MYDSATDTALAGQAYQRAVNISNQNRARLNQQFGLNADGSMDTTAAGQLGSIYQDNLSSVTNEHQAETADRRRGFAGGGLGGKAQAAAHSSSLTRQALDFQGASAQLGQNTQERQQADYDWQNDQGTIASKSAFDLANTLADNPVYGDLPAPSPNYASNPALKPSPALKKAQQNQNRLTNIGFNARY